MRFAVLGSGSAGNATVIEHRGHAVLIDAGFSATEIERRLARVGIPLSDIEAIVVTHEHGDHIKGVVLTAYNAGCTVYLTEKTSEFIKWRDDRFVDVKYFSPGDEFCLGYFTCKAIRVPHDSAEAVVVRVTDSEDTGLSVVVATDQGMVTPRFVELAAGANGLVLESNHDPDLLATAPYNSYTKERISSDRGHLSNQQAAAFIRNDFDGVAEHLVLAHLSSRANTAREAQRSAEAALSDIGLDGITNLIVSTQSEPTPMLTLSS